MQFHIRLRFSEDWDTLNSNNYHYTWDQAYDKGMYQANIKAWDHLTCNYFQYRHHLKQLAAANWRFPVNRRRIIDIKRDGGVVLPLDDDDYHYPNLAEYLREAFKNPSVNIVSWDTWVLRLVRVTRIGEFLWKKGRVASNCYALRGDAIQWSLIMNHTLVQPDVHLPVKLGLRIEHPASAYYLDRQLIKDRLKIKWRPLSPPSDLEWANEVIGQLINLTKSLRWQTIFYE